jgi:phosphotransferase system HPr (HPr) family protein
VKRSKVSVPWREGLHLRRAARLVQIAQRFRSSIVLSLDGKAAELRSILSILTLCATMGATLDLEANGDDEQNAIAAVQEMFSADEGADSDSAGSQNA